ncbi:glycoside hydrolase family 3 N-terminal domain-containing protein [Flavicella marina]|uniref:glycoside hydrolase family 3 N-terminal domain-containing protein n=1 Tax=Flavicella marina TaxID=1475951 RepID=UPI001264C699|nr:glycoside hydrolase family 3 N-terminal domain-containing protein [Flavicella marina]
MKYSFFVFLISAVFSLSAQQLDPLLTKDVAAQEQWVEAQLSAMSLDEKIGQLFMIQAYSNKDKKHRKFIESEIKKYHIGGLIFMQGTPEKQAELNNRYQKKSKIPLLIGFDGEWGLDMRLKNTFRYPWNMTLGAVQEDQLIKNFGQRLGVHCKRMGIHINFAPVVDINTNPENPIIGNRSFGENKYNVTRKAAAFIEGMQSENVLANAKHFPGHGDTATDSHKTLPQLLFDYERLDAIELYPYTKIFDTGLSSVMVAHLSVPALEPNPEVPTSISYKVITNLLKEKMGFNGLIFTDALNMKGAANYAKPGEIDLAAFLAGNDMLLIPEDVGAAVKKIKRALNTGVLTMERLEFSVRKILKAKYWAGLDNYQPVVLDHLKEDLNTVQDSILHASLVKESITLVQNKNAVFPIKEFADTKTAYVKLGDDNNAAFFNMLNKYITVTEVKMDSVDSGISKLKNFDQVIIGYHKSNSNPWKNFKFQKEELELLQTIAQNNRVILAVFASPYSLLDINSFDSIDGVVVAYQNSIYAQEIAAQALFGVVETHGKLPVSIGGHFKEGTGLSSLNLMRLGYGKPESVGMSSQRLKRIDSVVHEIIKEEMTPGAQVLVARYGQVVYEKSFGYHTYEKKTPVKNSDVYDLASLTKILGGAPMLMRAEEIGMFDLDSTLGELMPVYKNSNKDTLTVKEMYSHTARLKAWLPFYKKTIDSLSHKPLPDYYSTTKDELHQIKVAENMFLRTDYKDSIYQEIRDVDQREAIGYKYSGLAFYIFKEYMESNLKTGMDTLLTAYFYKKLGAETLRFNPLGEIKKERIVPSEIDAYYRHQTLQGYVHDMGAAMMGGVNGNAGLFGNANDVAKMMQLFLQNGYYGGHRYLEEKTIKKFNRRYFEQDSIRRGLIFDKPQLNPEVKNTCGCVSQNSFGHSGFTGTYAWADPDTGLLYVFLSNRTYPTMENNKLGEEDIRTKIQQLVVDAIVE